MGPQESWNTHPDCGETSGAPGHTGSLIAVFYTAYSKLYLFVPTAELASVLKERASKVEQQAGVWSLADMSYMF